MIKKIDFDDLCLIILMVIAGIIAITAFTGFVVAAIPVYGGLFTGKMLAQVGIIVILLCIIGDK